MDMMEIRRRVMQMAANAAKILQGTFVGDGTSTKEIACNFYPDVIICWHEENTNTDVTYIGLVCDLLMRGIFSVSLSDNSNNSHAMSSYPHRIAGGLLDYNESTFSNREFYAEVDGQSVTMKHNSGTTNFGKYTSGETYNYAFIKY